MMAIEYLNRFECYFLNTAAAAVELVRMVNHPNFRTMYDSFHAHIEEKDPAAAIRTVAPVLAHVHISENDRGTPGTGQVNWDATFKTLKEVKYDGWLTIEAFGRALPDLAAATQDLARSVPQRRGRLHEGHRVHQEPVGAIVSAVTSALTVRTTSPGTAVPGLRSSPTVAVSSADVTRCHGTTSGTPGTCPTSGDYGCGARLCWR